MSLSRLAQPHAVVFRGAAAFRRFTFIFTMVTTAYINVMAAPRRSTTSDPPTLHSLQMLSPGPTSISSYNQLAGARPSTVTIDDHDAEIVSGKQTFRGVAKGMRNVAIVCPAGGKWFMAQPDVEGRFSVDVDVPDVSGPMAVDVYSWDSAPNTYPYTVNINQRFDLFVKGQLKVKAQAAPFGMKLVWSEDFDEPLSIGSGRHQEARWFSGGKPSASASQYSDAFFVSKQDSRNPFFVKDGFLRIRAMHAVPDRYPSAAWWSGHLSTGFPDESASFQFRRGYAEVRMKVPLGRGAWPAFSLMDSASTLPSKRYGAVEIDVMEAYGHDPTAYMATEHQWPGVAKEDTHNFQAQRVSSAGKITDGFHTYGVRLTEADVVWYFDSEEVYRVNLYRPKQVSPFYLMLDLAIGGGWPVVVPPSGYYDLWVDYVHVYE